MNSICHLLCRIRKFMPHNLLILVFNSLALPHLYYSFINYPKQYKTNFNKICFKFNQCGTVVNNCTLKHLYLHNWPNLHKKIEDFRISFIHKVLKSPYDEPLLQYLKPNNHTYNTRHKGICSLQRHSKKLTEQSFQFWAPYLINQNQDKFHMYPSLNWLWLLFNISDSWPKVLSSFLLLFFFFFLSLPKYLQHIKTFFMWNLN